MVELELRAPSVHEAAAIADALNALSRSLYGTDDTTETEIRSWFSQAGLDPAQDIRIAALADGTVAGYADLGGGYGEPPRFWLDLRVRPGYAEAGVPLLAELERRARRRARGPAVLRSIASAQDQVAARLLQEAGLRQVRSSYRMELDLSDPPASPSWPSGLGPRLLAPGEGDRRIYEAHQAGFADHWEFHPTPIEEWRHWTTREPFDPSLWFLVEDASEIAGLCLCRPHETGDPELGWISILTVLPAWRRRGLGRALLLHAFAALRARGRVRAGLGVDAENTAGAVRLYEDVGMHVVRRNDIYEKELA